MNDTMVPSRRRPHVVMLCGIAGAGKTTYARTLEAQGYVRLSIDEEIWRRFGCYGIDYPAEEYAHLSALAEESLAHALPELIAAGRDCVIDFSFWQRARRDRYRALIADAGGHADLRYLKVDPDVLKERLARRSARFDANAAFPITEAMLAAYLARFEAPDGEGETIVASSEPTLP